MIFHMTDTQKQNTALFVITKEAATMGDALFFLILSGAGAAVLALAYLIFELFLFFLYKHDGGRMDLVSYFKKL